MLDADMNVRYWKGLAQKCLWKDRSGRIFLAVISCGTVAGWSIWENWPTVWKFLSCLSTLVAVILPFMKYESTIKDVAYLSGKWLEVLQEYEGYWRRIESGEDAKGIEKQYMKTKAKERPLVEKEAKIIRDKKLLDQCYEEVLRSRGLTQ